MRTTPFALALASFMAAVALAQEAPKRSEGEQKAIAKIRQIGGLVLEVAQNDAHLEVSYQGVDKVADDQLAPLKDLKGVVYLNLRGKDVTDDQLANVAGLTDLTHLHLEKTKGP